MATLGRVRARTVTRLARERRREILQGEGRDKDELDLHKVFIAEARKYGRPEPDVITHVIDGFIIQESANPFPIDAIGSIESFVADDIINLFLDDEKVARRTPPLKRTKYDDCKHGKSPRGGGQQCDGVEMASSSGRHADEEPENLCLFCKRDLRLERYDRCPQYCTSKCKKAYRRQLKRVSHDGARDGSDDLTPSPAASSASVSFMDEVPKLTVKRSLIQPAMTTPSATIVKSAAIAPIMANQASHGQHEITAMVQALSVPSQSAGQHQPRPDNPRLWTKEHVQTWVSEVSGNRECGEVFVSEDIDGPALLMLEDEHLKTQLRLKLGPALKVGKELKKLKEQYP